MQVSITEAANNLPDLVTAALNGEEVILFRGRPTNHQTHTHQARQTSTPIR